MRMCVCAMYRAVRGDSFDKGSLHRDCKEVKDEPHRDLAKELSRQRDHKCKSPDRGAGFVCLMNSNGARRVGNHDGRRGQVDNRARSHRALQSARRTKALTLSVLRHGHVWAEEFHSVCCERSGTQSKGWEQEGGMAGTADCHLIVTCPFLL